MGAVREATIEDADLLARVAATGFFDDPVLSWVLPNADTRLMQLTFLFAGMVRDMLPTGGTVHLAGGASAAFWRSPGYEHGRTARDRVEPAEEESGAAASAFARDELERLGVLGEAMMAAHPHEPHWYLNVLSTLPERQGHGLGAAALHPVLQRCDTDGTPAYLESTNPRNLTLYRRDGFLHSGEIRLEGGPSMTQMWREPRVD